MKKICLFLTLFVILALACDLSGSASTNPTPPPDATVASSDIAVEVPATPFPSTEIPKVTPTEPQPSFEGVPAFIHPLNLVLPQGLASGISGEQFPQVDGEDLPYWELTPGHTAIKLEGYLLQGKFHEPQIYIYPAMGYAELFPGAFESMHRLRNVMNDPNMTSVDVLPAVPFFNAAQIFASNFQKITTDHIEGVRFLTEYAQYTAPINNHELIYHFEGFSHDGEYYIVVIFPITAPVLAATDDPGAVLPSGGVAFPDINDPNANFQIYYAAITALLNGTSPDTFSPTLGQLDQLIQSMQITP